VGRCDDEDDRQVILLDVDVHRDGEGGRSKQEYLERASRFGVWKKHARLVLDRSRVTSIQRLGDL
jgi:hypothetical protein